MPKTRIHAPLAAPRAGREPVTGWPQQRRWTGAAVNPLSGTQRMVAQRRALDAMFGAATQRDAAADNEGLQMKPKLVAAQRLAAEDKEPLQAQGRVPPTMQVGSARQLKKTQVSVTGITHSVRVLPERERSTDDELITAHRSFAYNEVRELSEPQKVWIETKDGTKLSRRGPNQESFQDVDLQSPKFYVWHAMLGDAVPHNPVQEYIREDTFSFEEKDIPGWVKIGLTPKSDVNTLRIAAENIIQQHLPIPMTTTSLGKVFLDTEDDYRDFLDRVLVQQFRVNGTPIPEDRAKDKEWQELLGSQVHSTSALTELGEVHINNKKADFGTFIHELMHFYGQQDVFIKLVCGGNSAGFNEGVTEYFARHVKKAIGIAGGSYKNEIKIVDDILTALGGPGFQLLLDAYFRGNVEPLIDELKRVKKWPPNQ